jgi:hypothetical protein
MIAQESSPKTGQERLEALMKWVESIPSEAFERLCKVFEL